MSGPTRSSGKVTLSKSAHLDWLIQADTVQVPGSVASWCLITTVPLSGSGLAWPAWDITENAIIAFVFLLIGMVVGCFASVLPMLIYAFFVQKGRSRKVAEAKKRGDIVDIPREFFTFVHRVALDSGFSDKKFTSFRRDLLTELSAIAQSDWYHYTQITVPEGNKQAERDKERALAAIEERIQRLMTSWQNERKALKAERKRRAKLEEAEAAQIEQQRRAALEAEAIANNTGHLKALGLPEADPS